MEKHIFRRLVAAGFIKSLTLSIAGMIDCIIVGHFLGASGLSAMKLAMPVFSVLSLFSSILSTGLSVAVSRELTRGSRDRAIATMQSVFTFCVFIAALSMLIGFVCPSALTVLLAGKDIDMEVFRTATDYVAPILISALPLILYDVLGTLAMLEGADRHMRVASVVLLVANVAGDLVVVHMNAGMKGIAAATGFSYLCAFAVVTCFFFGKRSMFRLKLRMPEAGSLWNVTVLGLPMLVRGLCGILWPMAVNRLMIRYGTMSGLAALSIQDAIHYLPAALCSGIASATLILAGIYAGEQDREGQRNLNASIIKWSMIGGTLISLVLAIAAAPLLRLFSDDEEILALGISALRLYLMGVPFLALNFASAAYLQGVGKNREAGMVIFINHILISISSAFVLAKFFGTKGIFASYGICEVIMTGVLLINIAVVLFLQRRKRTPEKEEQKTELRKSIQSIEDAVEASMQVHRFCLENGLNSRDAHNIALCTEELAVNSIEHGFNDGKKHNLELRVVIGEGRLILRLRDDGRRFDLVERYKMINPDDPTKNIGLRIVFAKADEVKYSSALSLNNVCVIYNAGQH